MAVRTVSYMSLSLVRLVDTVFGGKIHKLPWHPVRYACAAVPSKEFKEEIDVESTMKNSPFQLSPSRLVELCKEICATEFGCTKVLGAFVMFCFLVFVFDVEDDQVTARYLATAA